MLAAFAFLRSPLGKWAGVVLGLLLLVGLIRHSGIEHERQAEAKRYAAAQAKAAEKARADAAMVDGLRQQLEQAQTATADRTVTITKRIPVYVSKAADSRCSVGAGFVRAYDAAALGLPAPAAGAGGSDEAPSGVALSGLLAVDVANLGAAHDALGEAQAWRDWYAKLTPAPAAKAKRKWWLF